MRTRSLLVEWIDQLRDALRETKRTNPFHIDAMMVLSEHLHVIWTLPPNDDDYSGRWRAIKARFTRALVESGVGLQRVNTICGNAVIGSTHCGLRRTFGGMLNISISIQ